MATLIFGIPLYTVFTFIVVAGLISGKLLPTWIFVNSMQLIFYLVLIKTDLPSYVHFFMLDFLDSLRLRYDWTEALAD